MNTTFGGDLKMLVIGWVDLLWLVGKLVVVQVVVTKKFEIKFSGNTYPSEITANERRHYYRNNVKLQSFRGDPHFSDYTQKAPDSLNYNAVIKGLPLTSQFVPCPYYLPDDFVLIQFDNAQPRSKYSTVRYCNN